MKRTPIRRLKGLVRKTRLNPRSQKMQVRYVERRALVERLLRERPRCEFPTAAAGMVVRDGTGSTYDDGRRCTRPSEHLHEKLTRARGGSIMDETNIMLLCSLHHSWVHSNPAHATDLGLLVPSWGVTQEMS